ncbi:MAG: hypothetical protein GKR89_25805 [Candidatus Latescibacteria bacterium]|nr:hypothetical protein [Candidatus Latescibacterota bacterium]
MPADSTIVPVAVATDSTADSLRTDPLRPWLKWKDLGRAIALRPLDGPTDIMEKTEIIQDRLDALEEAKSPLQGSLQHPAERLAAIEIQLEVLQDLAQLQRGGDLELQQRLHDMRADRRRLEQAMRPYWAALADLQREIDRLNELLRHYQSRAADLRRKEEIIR